MQNLPNMQNAPNVPYGSIPHLPQYQQGPYIPNHHYFQNYPLIYQPQMGGFDPRMIPQHPSEQLFLPPSYNPLQAYGYYQQPPALYNFQPISNESKIEEQINIKTEPIMDELIESKLYEPKLYESNIDEPKLYEPKLEEKLNEQRSEAKAYEPSLDPRIVDEPKSHEPNSDEPKSHEVDDKKTEVQLWLENCGFHKYIDLFKENEMDFLSDLSCYSHLSSEEVTKCLKLDEFMNSTDISKFHEELFKLDDDKVEEYRVKVSNQRNKKRRI